MSNDGGYRSLLSENQVLCPQNRQNASPRASRRASSTTCSEFFGPCRNPCCARMKALPGRSTAKMRCSPEASLLARFAPRPPSAHHHILPTAVARAPSALTVCGPWRNPAIHWHAWSITICANTVYFQLVSRPVGRAMPTKDRPCPRY